jgi:hypothetical protein
MSRIFKPAEEGSFITGHGIAFDHGQKKKYSLDQSWGGSYRSPPNWRGGGTHISAR